jgi:Bacterial TniB protein
MIEHVSPEPTSDPLPRPGQGMTAIERLALVDRILVRHPRFNAALAQIDYCNLFATEIPTSNPPCLAILGETGAGKTTLVRTWIANSGLARIETPQGSIIPYLYVSVPAGATIKATASNFLKTLGDPNAGRGTQWNMVERLYMLIEGCRVRMIFVDEFQHIVEKEKRRILYNVADFLKDIINHTCVPMILIGRLGEAEPIFQVNPQLDRRIGSPLILEPFAWDRKRPDTTVYEFCELMGAIDAALPLDSSGLGEEDMAFRFFYATNGYLGHVMDLIRHAAKWAVDAGCATLNLPLLEAAYNRCIASTEMGRGKVNPFTAEFDESTAKVVLPVEKPAPLPGPSSERATTNRGQTKANSGEQAPKQKTSEVLKKRGGGRRTRKNEGEKA